MSGSFGRWNFWNSRRSHKCAALRRARQLNVEGLEGRDLMATVNFDSAFGTGGKTTTDFGSSTNDYAFAVTEQSNGNILVAGKSGNNMAVARYTSAVVLDYTFS